MTAPGSEPSPPSPARAFPSVPRVDLYFPGRSIEECRERIVRCVERGDGPAIVVGGAGIGKSMLMAVVAKSLSDRLEVAPIASTQLCTRRALLQAILFGLGMPYNNREEGELRLALVSRLEDPSASPRPVALLIDEAQALPVRLLEELRILSNLQRDGESMVRIVLAGSSALEEHFASTELEAFSQRLAARCYLSPLNYSETHQYVQAHVAAAGAATDRLFTPEALDSVFSASDGVPRLINQVCDRAILMAVDRDAAVVDQQLVQAAWSDLHQLPAPWHNADATIPTPETDVVEFGVLPGGDEDNEALAALTGGELSTLANVTEFACESACTLPVVGDWNADAALDSVTSETIETDIAANDNDAGSDEGIPRSGEPSEPAFDTTEPESEVTPDASELFGDGFDEEEVVIDRFASLDSVIPAGAPAVVNTQDPSLGAMLDEHAAAGAVEPAAETDNQLVPAQPVAVTEAQPPTRDAFDVLPINAEVQSSPAMDSVDVSSAEDADDHEPMASESGVLIIEPDASAIMAEASTVHRQEYRQLFANLRRS